MPYPPDPSFAPEEYVKVLVFMDVGSPNLVDASAQAQASILTALKQIARHVKRRLFVRVLVHGYQTQNAVEIDSKLLYFDRDPLPQPQPPPPPPAAAAEAHHGLSWGGTDDRRAPAFTADGEALKAFVMASLAEVPPGEDPNHPPPFRTLLFLWGHGEGVGNRLERAHDAGGSAVRLPASVAGAGLLGCGGAEESPLRKLRAIPQPDDRNGQPRPVFDLLVFDSCLMATSELAFECKDLSRFVIASQSFVMRPGLSLGRSIAEYLVAIDNSVLLQVDRDARPALGATRAKGEHAPSEPGKDPVLDAAKAVIDTAGELHSGADQLTLFRVEKQVTDAGPLQAHEALSRWIVVSLAAIDGTSPRAPRPQPGNHGPYQPPNVWEPLVDSFQSALSTNYPSYGVFAAFSHLLRWASADEDEYPRILVAFENALYVKVRQFLDLKDLARQIYHYSRLTPLRIVALELMRELEERDDGFVVRWRATIGEDDKKRYGGVSVYCPWFEAHGSEEFDGVVEHDVYRALDLPHLTGWAGFVLGSMYEVTAGERERDARRGRWRAEQDGRWLRLLKDVICECCCHGGPRDDGGLPSGLVKGSGPQGDVKGSRPQGDIKGSRPQGDFGR